MLGKDAGWSKRLDEKARNALTKDLGSAWDGSNNALWCIAHIVNLAGPRVGPAHVDSSVGWPICTEPDEVAQYRAHLTPLAVVPRFLP